MAVRKSASDGSRCPFCGSPLSSYTHYRVSGGEDEAKPFSVISDTVCAQCKCNVTREMKYDFDKGVVEVVVQGSTPVDFTA